KVLRKKPQQLQDAVVRCVRLLADNPAHPGLNVHRLRGVPGVWEAYVDKANRVTFERRGDVIVMRNNCNHDILRPSP
ncbi:MAG TPA: hypothetical protein VFM37_05955, partial [Pseudonocardiaceae bacterium]|nr:hypothetical protein [Pseudonocardiaceae bacterium]